jgi:gas vesicle protein
LSEQTHTSNRLFITTLSFSLGAIAALLFAPKSGKELRRNIADKYSTLEESTVSLAQQVKDKTVDLSQKVSDRALTLVKQAGDKSQDLAQQVSDKTNELTQTASDKTLDLGNDISDKISTKRY